MPPLACSEPEPEIGPPSCSVPEVSSLTDRVVRPLMAMPASVSDVPVAKPLIDALPVTSMLLFADMSRLTEPRPSVPPVRVTRPVPRDSSLSAISMPAVMVVPPW
jgi:hypothetical protein